MKEILIIRHAESLANIGEKTGAHDTIPLSEKGKAQAEELVERLTIIPQLIVVSPYTRTHDTAKPFIIKNQYVPVETWKVHEFTYLSPQVYNGTSSLDRADAIEKYWNSADIHYRDGKDSETYYEFVVRVKEFIALLKARPEKNIVIFSHGMFIHTLLTYVSYNEDDVSEKSITEMMCSYKDLLGKKFPIENVSIHAITL
jgi:2,3-bisphosphoglycerate-dependent phosphoglycerate mutase